MHRQQVREALGPRKGWGLALSPGMGVRGREQERSGSIARNEMRRFISRCGSWGGGEEHCSGFPVIEREAANKSNWCRRSVFEL